MALELNPQQKLAAQAGHTCAVVASAGTGKTGTLTERYLAELRAGKSPLQIVAVTFTNKAAGELRERIRKAIREEYGVDSVKLAELDIAPIGTFHTLCGRICREHPAAAGVAPGFAQQDEQQSRLFQAEHLDDILVNLGADTYDPAMMSLATVREAMRKLLDQPLLAEAALAVLGRPWDEVRKEWENELAARQAGILAELRGPTWDEQVGYLKSLRSSDPDDALAQAHRTALVAIAEIEKGSDLLSNLAVIGSCGDGRIGRKAAWAPLDVTNDVRRPLYKLRDECSATLTAYAACVLTDADETLWFAAHQLAKIYRTVSQELHARMEQAGVLDFAGLETGALRALGIKAVRDWYAARWTVLLVDETQDINRTQSELIEALIGSFEAPSVCLVGDAKQSIYGFRGADVEQFARLHSDVIGEKPVVLQQTYRQHAVIAAELNTLFGPILGETLRADVISEKQPPHKATKYFELAIVQDPVAEEGQPKPDVSLRDRRWVEANWVAERIEGFVRDKLQVSQRDGTTRDVGYGDIAILGRAWAILDTVQEALAARNIPSVHGGGGSLLETREALDGLALLRFLAHTDDNLSLAAVLRSPWFAISDRELLAFTAHTRWWPAVRDGNVDLGRARQVLGGLVEQTQHLAAHELLQLADRLTGYTAALANLPLGDRRLADWRAFEKLVMDLESSGAHAFQVCRRLKELIDLELDVERPVIEATNAVSLLSIHASKGLEFPIVFAPDLARKSPPRQDKVRIDRERGVAVRPPSDSDTPFLWRDLGDAAKLREETEARRLLYVACTRAGDRLILSAAANEDAPDPDSNPNAMLLKLLKIGWDDAGWPTVEIPYDPAKAVPPTLPKPVAKQLPNDARVLAEPLGACLDSLPASSLDTYRRCPREFFYQQIERNEGLAQGRGSNAREVGTLVHLAIEKDLRDLEALRRTSPELPDGSIEEAARLARVWRESPVFEPVRQSSDVLEKHMGLPLGSLRLSGKIDRLGDHYVVDYKTGADVAAEEHELQVWAYARAEGREQGYIADLRGPKLVPIDAARLTELDDVAAEAARGIAADDFTPRPDEERCKRCAYCHCEHHPLARTTNAT